MTASADELERRAKLGDTEAQLALGRHFETQNKTVQARAWFAHAAKNGSLAGMRSLAINLLTQVPVAGDLGVNMIRGAADQGDPEAIYICALLAAQDVNLVDRWSIARQYLERSAERGWPLARTQLEFLQRMPKDFDAAVSAMPMREIFNSPRVAVIENCASSATCDWLIERARPRLQRAQVYDHVSGEGRHEEGRSNRVAEFNIAQSDMVLILLRARIAMTTQLSDLEASSVLHYTPGQQFEPHFDFLDSTKAGYARDLRERGQRVATFLVYLNENYEGGETDFPKLNWRYKGRKGDAMVFWNVDATGLPDTRALHAGLPPTSGEKWLFSQWLRKPVRQ